MDVQRVGASVLVPHDPDNKPSLPRYNYISPPLLNLALEDKKGGAYCRGLTVCIYMYGSVVLLTLYVLQGVSVGERLRRFDLSQVHIAYTGMLIDTCTRVVKHNYYSF